MLLNNLNCYIHDLLPGLLLD